MTQSGDVVIAELEADDIRPAIDVLADSFIDFPALQIMAGSDAGAHGRMERIFAMQFEPESKLSALVARLDGRVAGALTYTDSPACSAISAGRMTRFVRIAGPRLFRVMRMLGRIERAHPTTPHRHLPTVGVDPGLQNRGIGSRLMEELGRRCDRDGTAAYLETVRWADSTKPSLERFYGRLGYVVSAEIPMTDEWSVLTMTRPAARAGPAPR